MLILPATKINKIVTKLIISQYPDNDISLLQITPTKMDEIIDYIEKCPKTKRERCLKFSCSLCISAIA